FRGQFRVPGRKARRKARCGVTPVRRSETPAHPIKRALIEVSRTDRVAALGATLKGGCNSTRLAVRPVGGGSAFMAAGVSGHAAADDVGPALVSARTVSRCQAQSPPGDARSPPFGITGPAVGNPHKFPPSAQQCLSARE